jgi:hypothetical protein
MNKHAAAPLRIDHAQLTNFGPIMPRNVQQPPVTDLAAHLRVERCAIDNDIEFVGFFTREDGFNDCFRFEKIVAEKSCRCRFDLVFFDTDFFFLLRLACTVALFLHQTLESGDIDSQSALTCH